MGTQKGRHFRRLFKWLLIIILIVACAAAGLAWYASRLLLPPAYSNEVVRVSLPAGTGISAFAEQLQQKGLIRNAAAFVLYVKWKQEGSRFQAGEYDMAVGMSHDDIIRQLNAGETVKEETLRLTVPEGFTAEQIAGKLEPFGITPEQFIAAVQNPGAYESKWLDSLPDDDRLKFRLEGYLFPETYEFSKEEPPKPEQMVERMLAELDRKLATLPEDWEQAMRDKNLTFHELLTIASLIEREIVLDEERPIAAGVIYNRLKLGMKLQIDATVQYLFEEQRDRVLYADLEIESPYNTYLHYGLPPGPIASPSISSIKAALYPQESNYLFYVTKKDGTSGHYFAETFEEHQKYNADSKQNAASAQQP